jgi:hypothetical protein
MTVGIGAVAGSGNSVLMVADTKGSYNDPRYSDTLIGKQYDFSPHHLLTANIAGTVYCGHGSCVPVSDVPSGC